MTNGQGMKCEDHPKISDRCFCDEDRDRSLRIHRVSQWDDGMGGYLCICMTGRFSVKYGCMGEGYGKKINGTRCRPRRSKR